MSAIDKPAAKSVAVIVAHPDDETLWAGGTILSHPSWSWYIVTLCRAGDPDRAPKFFRVLQVLGATGKMADLDDGPDQNPLDESEVQATILSLLPPQHFDLVITHSPTGEYTRHRRHEEIGTQVHVQVRRDRGQQLGAGLGMTASGDVSVGLHRKPDSCAKIGFREVQPFPEFLNSLRNLENFPGGVKVFGCHLIHLSNNGS